MIYSLAPVVSNGELGHLAKDCLQNKEPTTNAETFFSGMVCNDSCTVHPRNDFCADHSRDNSRAGVSRNESRADDDSRNEPSANVDSRNGLCVESDFHRDDETFFRKLALGGKNSLTNMGNTCFLNTGLQCLAHLEPLVAFFLTGKFKGELNFNAKIMNKHIRSTLSRKLVRN